MKTFIDNSDHDAKVAARTALKRLRKIFKELRKTLFAAAEVVEISDDEET